jgi:hypothetical protein
MWQHLAASENDERSDGSDRAHCQRAPRMAPYGIHNAEQEREASHRKRQAQQQEMRDEWKYSEGRCVC